MPSVGVLGGGIFGVSAALELRRRGCDVTLYEPRDALLQGASARNLFRLHRGFHYPRDEETARQAGHGFGSFVDRYAAAVTVGSSGQYYAVADQGSRTSVAEFERHCRQVGLQATVVERPSYLTDAVERCWQVHEPYFDPGTLRAIMVRELRDAGVRVVLRARASAARIERDHDRLVLAVYADTNEVLGELGLEPFPMQYDLCEVPIVRAPALRDRSVVVMDGPFVSIAPYGDGAHLLYDVQHSVHARATASAKPRFAGFERLVSGTAPAVAGPSHLGAIVASAQRFFADLDGLEHLGSFYSVRVVPPEAGATDARPTTVRWASPGVLVVLSGKIATCIDAARAVGEQILPGSGRRAPWHGPVSQDTDVVAEVTGGPSAAAAVLR